MLFYLQNLLSFLISRRSEILPNFYNWRSIQFQKLNIMSDALERVHRVPSFDLPPILNDPGTSGAFKKKKLFCALTP